MPFSSWVLISAQTLKQKGSLIYLVLSHSLHLLPRKLKVSVSFRLPVSGSSVTDIKDFVSRQTTTKFQGIEVVRTSKDFTSLEFSVETNNGLRTKGCKLTIHQLEKWTKKKRNDKRDVEAKGKVHLIFSLPQGIMQSVKAGSASVRKEKRQDWINKETREETPFIIFSPGSVFLWFLPLKTQRRQQETVRSRWWWKESNNRNVRKERKGRESKAKQRRVYQEGILTKEPKEWVTPEETRLNTHLSSLLFFPSLRRSWVEAIKEGKR